MQNRRINAQLTLDLLHTPPVHEVTIIKLLVEGRRSMLSANLSERLAERLRPIGSRSVLMGSDHCQVQRNSSREDRQAGGWTDQLGTDRRWKPQPYHDVAGNEVGAQDRSLFTLLSNQSQGDTWRRDRSRPVESSPPLARNRGADPITAFGYLASQQSN